MIQIDVDNMVDYLARWSGTPKPSGESEGQYIIHWLVMMAMVA